MPSDWYAKKDASVNGLLQASADDLTELFHEGVTISVTPHGLVKLFLCQDKYLGPYQLDVLPYIPISFQAFGAEVDGEPCTFYGIYVACKGDWPWVRKAYGLSTGFASLRKCHYCSGQDPSLAYNNLWFDKFSYPLSIHLVLFFVTMLDIDICLESPGMVGHVCQW